MLLSEYRIRALAVESSPITQQNALLDNLEQEILTSVDKDDASLLSKNAYLGNISILRSRLLAGNAKIELLNKAISQSNMSLTELNPDDNELIIYASTNRANAYCFLAEDTGVFERLDYYEQAVKDYNSIIERCNASGLYSLIPAIVNNMAHATASISELAAPADAAMLLEEAIESLMNLDMSLITEERISQYINITLCNLKILLGITKGGDEGLAALEVGLDNLENILSNRTQYSDPVKITMSHIDTIDHCIVWSMLHGPAEYLLTRAKHNIYAFRNLPEVINHPLGQLRMMVLERETQMLMHPEKAALDLAPIPDEIVRQSTGPLDKPILYARAVLVTAWLQKLLHQDKYVAEASKAIKALWPAYSPNQEIPYPKKTIPYYLITNAIKLCNS